MGGKLILKKFKSQVVKELQTLALNLRRKLLLIQLTSLYLWGRSTRVRNAPEHYYGFHITAEGDTFISDSTLVSSDEPNSYEEAMAALRSAKWKEAMDSEIQLPCMTIKFGTWLTMYQVRKTVGCKWIFKKKTDMDGKVHTYKADWLQRVSLKLLELIMMRPSLQ